jgi:aspartyl-tRNA synthetase
MLRTHTCGQLNISNLGETVTLCGWVQKSRDLGGTTFIDVRDRYGLTQLVLNTDTDAGLREAGRNWAASLLLR